MNRQSAIEFEAAPHMGHDTVLCESGHTGQQERSVIELSHVNPSPNVPPPTSLAGFVDAILEVGHQRKLLLDQVRSALISGNDAEALSYARRLCGLPEQRTP